jgi:hypothetical protein
VGEDRVTGRMLAQLAWVAARDAERAEDESEHWRLHTMASALFDEAAANGFTNTGTDAVFGTEEKNGKKE